LKINIFKSFSGELKDKGILKNGEINTKEENIDKDVDNGSDNEKDNENDATTMDRKAID